MRGFGQEAPVPYYSGGTYTDAATGYLLASDPQGYADASVALVQAETFLTDIAGVIVAYERFITDAGNAGYSVPDAVLTDYAVALGAQDTGTQNKATLQTYVDQYRFYVFGSGQGQTPRSPQRLAGLGVLPLLAIAISVGIVAVAAAIGYFLYKSYDLAGARLTLQGHLANYQTWLGQQGVSGALDPATVQTLSNNATQLAGQVASGGGLGLGSLFSGAGGLVAIAVVGLLVFTMVRK